MIVLGGSASQRSRGEGRPNCCLPVHCCLCGNDINRPTVAAAAESHVCGHLYNNKNNNTLHPCARSAQPLSPIAPTPVSSFSPM